MNNNSRIKKNLKSKIGVKTLHISFGIPGSGKTTLFEILSSQTKNEINNKTRFEANEYPGLYDLKEKNVNNNGEIKKKKFLVFNPSKLSDAHEWCKTSVENEMMKNTEHIYQSNTNLDPCDMINYLILAYNYDYIVKIHIPRENKILQYPTNKSFNNQVLTIKNHRTKINYNVNNEIIEKYIPTHILDSMIETFIKNGKKLRLIKNILRENESQYDPELWIKNILVNFNCNHRINKKIIKEWLI